MISSTLAQTRDTAVLYAVDIALTVPPGAERFLSLLGIGMWILALVSTAGFIWGGIEMITKHRRGEDTNAGLSRMGWSALGVVIGAGAGSFVGFLTGWSF